MNAYVYSAISSQPFCESALHSFLLMLKNSAKFAFVNGIGNVFMMLAKCAISILTTLISYCLLYVMVGNVEHPFMPCLLIFITSYLVASTFITVFDVSANTILQCYLIDVDIMKQKDSVPVHVPEKLKKFLD